MALFQLIFEGFDLCVFWYDVASPGAILVIGKLWGLTREEGRDSNLTFSCEDPSLFRIMWPQCGFPFPIAVSSFNFSTTSCQTGKHRKLCGSVEADEAFWFKMKLRLIALRDLSCMSGPIIFWLNPFSEAMSYVFSSFMIPNFEVSPLYEGKGRVSYRD